MKIKVSYTVTLGSATTTFPTAEAAEKAARSGAITAASYGKAALFLTTTEITLPGAADIAVKDYVYFTGTTAKDTRCHRQRVMLEAQVGYGYDSIGIDEQWDWKE